ncbi:3-phosphoshikimate 1-carboxyvinyltransferase [Candidatus Woesearchaeota archaeon]|nr:3-phosphoshikimate 1-carboxyvinyltransferase [Candidatus Woesearchaeota archaeon]
MIEIIPVSSIDREISVPGSKYIANRALILAALAEGTSTIENLPENDDINNSITALSQFGIKARKEQDKLTITGGKIFSPREEINVGESGTLLRFITAVAALADGKTKITGSKRIQERPILDLVKSLNELGIKAESNSGCPPVQIDGGTLEGGITKIKGNISSQFISALLLVAPYAKSDVEIILENELVSKNYVDMTISLMKRFGVAVERQGYDQFKIKSNQSYRAINYKIPGDWSSATYFLGAAAITQGRIRVTGMDMMSEQGEAKFCDALSRMGCSVLKGMNWIELRGNQLKGIDINMANMPDAVQTLAAVACFAKGMTKITGISNLKYKESNRIDDTATELKKLGISVSSGEDELTINGGRATSATLESHNDHRMAMSLALIGLKIPGIRIENPECVKKSFPEYWNKLREIGVEIKNV